MRLLIINCLLFALLSSCKLQTIKGFTKTPPDQNIYKVPYFANKETDYVYKADIITYGKKLSGLFIAKQINDSVHRIVFTTEFGNTLFDFEIGKKTFKVNSIVNELNKKIVLKTLKNDFRLILANHYKVQAQYQNDTNKVYKSKDGNRYNYLFVNNKTNELYKIIRASRHKEKVIVTYAGTTDILAQEIIIQHKNIKLEISLNYLKQ